MRDSTLCVEASQWIYTVDDNATLSRFDPLTLSFDVIGALSCPTTSTPNSMALESLAEATAGVVELGHIVVVAAAAAPVVNDQVIGAVMTLPARSVTPLTVAV